MNLTLRLLEGELAIIRFPAEAPVPDWVAFETGPLMSVTHTKNELSIICSSSCVPPEVDAERHWRAFTIAEKLNFSAVGILAGILNPLAEAGVNILSVSTFDTDYVLVPAVRLEQALAALRSKFAGLE
jgi:hypothetical protein